MDEKMEIEEKEKLMLRVKKLIAMLSSPNPNEVKVANRKIKVLTDKYDIDIDLVKKIEDKQAFVEEVDIELNGNPKKWDLYLFDNCARFYDCRSLSGYKHMTMIGLPVDKDIAVDMYRMLKSTILDASKIRKIPKNLFGFKERRSKIRGDYRLGMVLGIRSTLDRLKEERSKISDSTALVVAKKEIIDQFVKDQYPDLGSFRAGSQRFSQSFYDGVEKGKTIQINQQVK